MRFWPKKRLTLREQRANIRNAMKKALADNDMVEYHRLNKHLQWLNGKIRKGKK